MPTSAPASVVAAPSAPTPGAPTPVTSAPVAPTPGAPTSGVPTPGAPAFPAAAAEIAASPGAAVDGSVPFLLRVRSTTPLTLRVIDVNGRRVRTLEEGDRAAGEYPGSWDGRTESGLRSAPGRYWIVLSIPGARSSLPVALVH